jgi:hypothetical protein
MAICKLASMYITHMHMNLYEYMARNCGFVLLHISGFFVT